MTTELTAYEILVAEQNRNTGLICSIDAAPEYDDEPLLDDDEVSCVWASYDGSQPCGLPLADNTDDELPYCDEHLPLIVRAQWAETDWKADRDYWAAGSY